MEKEQIDNVIQLFEQRPIDLMVSPVYITEKEAEIFENNESELLFYSQNLSTPLKVVLMGEVKAGKSTLLNAIAGGKISNTGVTETTAVIMEVAYGNVEEAVIYYKDNTIDKQSITSLYKTFEHNQDNPELFSSIKKVKATFPLNALQQIHIVDTPGVETSTAANHQTTIDYIQESDVVLWVLSVHHLGQASIHEQIMNVAEYGKPIIMVVNRIDQVSESPESILEYIEESYGLFIEKTFAVSAYQAFEGINNMNENLYRASGVPELIEYIQNNIEKSAANVKKISVTSSVAQILEKELACIIMAIEQIKFIESNLSDQVDNSNYYKNRINALIDDKVGEYIHLEFLKKEERHLLDEIQNQQNDLKKIKAAMKEYSSDSYIHSQVETFWQDLNDEVEKEIKHALHSMGQKLKENEARLHKKIAENLASHGIDQSIKGVYIYSYSDDLTVNVKKGAILGGSYGVALAAYTAVLGPYAASIGIGSALFSAMPPLLIAGLIGGAIYTYLNKENSNMKLQQMVIGAFEKIRLQVKDILREQISDMEQNVSKTFDELDSQMVSFFLGVESIEQISIVKNDLINYSADVQKLLLEWKQQKEDIDLQSNFEDIFK